MSLLDGGNGNGNGNAGGSQGGGAGGDPGSSGAGGGAGGGSGAPAGGSGGGSGAAATWRDTLPDDIRADATLGKYADINSLARAHISLQSVVGKKGIFPPTQESAPEAWKSFWKEIGQPEFEKFEIKTPDGKQVSNKEALELFRKQAHEAGLLPQQAQTMMNWLFEQEEAGARKRAEAAQAKFDEDRAALQKEWGDGFTKEAGKVRLVLSEFGDKETAQHFEKNGYLHDPVVVKLLNKASALLGEDKLREAGGGSGGGFGNTPAELQAELQKIMGHPGYTDPRHGEHKILTSRAEALFRKGAKLGA